MAAEQKIEDAGAGYSDPLYLASSDHPRMQISSMVFNGTNFLSWSRSIKMSLASTNKQGFIDGSCKCPEMSSKDHQRWMRNDHMVRCWLFRSMTDKIGESMILSESSKQLWDELLERYGESTAPQIFLKDR